MISLKFLKIFQRRVKVPEGVSGRHRFKVRDSYGDTPTPLIEFGNTDRNTLDDDLRNLLKNLGYKTSKIADVWMNDEVWVFFESKRSTLLFTRDIWGLEFLMNQGPQINAIKEVANQMDYSNAFERINAPL